MGSFPFWHQLTGLAAEELRELLLRRRSLLSLLFYVGVVVLTLWLLIAVQEVLGPRFDISLLYEPANADYLQAIEEYGLADELALFARLSGVPQALWMFQAFSLLWYPTLVALVSCDMVTVDVYRGTLRFVLSRALRSSYYFSKFLSHFLLYAVLQLISLLALVLVTLSRGTEWSVASYVRLALTYYLVFLPFVGCLVAATLWISSWNKRPTSALVHIHLFWVGILILMVKLPVATPFYPEYSIGLLAPFDREPLWSFLWLSLWTGIFAMLGYIGFSHRDL